MNGQGTAENRGPKNYFYMWTGVVKAVDGVSLEVKEGETLGLVGASSSGKPETALSILRILPRLGEIINGQVLYRGENLLKRMKTKRRSYVEKK